MRPAETAFNDFRDHLRRYLSRRLRNSDDVEDVLQDVFLRVLRNEDALRAARNPLAWLYTVTRSVMIDHVRKRQAADQGLRDLAQETGETPTEPPAPDFEACLVPLLDRLPAPYREALRLVDMEGMKQTELAARLGLGSSAAKSRVQRGRAMLREAIVACCRIDRDGRNAVAGLEPDAPAGERCC